MPLETAGNPIGIPFIEMQSVDSTNKYAMSLIHAGMAQHGMAIFAHTQLAGKGQRNKSWSSEPGSNIALSLIINPYPLMVSDSFRLSAYTAFTVASFLNNLINEDFKIKWPNDLYWRDRKAGGILIENIISSKKNESKDESPETWKWCVIGIGINLNQTSFPADLPNPVSLKQISGKDHQPVRTAKELCQYFNKNYQFLLIEKSNALFKEFNELLYKRNETVKLKKGNVIFDALIKGVSENGQLITRHAIEESFNFGTIEWVR